MLDLRLVRPFNVDLGFSLTEDTSARPAWREVRTEVILPGDRQILQGLTSGMDLVPTPYGEIAKELGRTEAEILSRIQVLSDAAVISRLEVIVRHRALGWRANAMVVWEIESEKIDTAGPRLSAHPGVTLCYERTPVPGVWPYRLYSMIHARAARRWMCCPVLLICRNFTACRTGRCFRCNASNKPAR